MHASKVANGNISPSRFVKLDTTAGRVVTTAANSDKVYGISQAGTRRAPFGALDDGYAAIAGEPLMIYASPHPDVVMLELGGTVAIGDRLTSSTAGVGVTTTTTGHEVGAIADAAGVSGDIIPVRLVSPAQF